MQRNGGSSSSSSGSKPAVRRPPRPSSPKTMVTRCVPSAKVRPVLPPVITRSLYMRSKSAAPPSPPPSSPHNSLGGIVADVAQKRYALLQLGPRPDHEKVEDARSRLREIEADLSKKLQEIVLSPRPENFDRLEWRARLAEKERGCREAVEKELSTYRAIISLDVMHEECEKTLREAEKRLVKMYESAEEKTTNRWYAEPSIGEGVRDGPMNLLRGGALEKERVNLSGRMLRLLPTELFGRCRGIKVLNLSGNQLEAIPDSIAVLGMLEELNISSNLLLSLPDSISSLDEMKVLNASGNKFGALPDTINYCRSLVELDVSFNNLVHLPTDIGYELLNLQVLYLQYNKIQSLPASITEMRSLRHLSAHFNELQGLPPLIGKLKNLETLNLSSNFTDLTELPHTIGDLTELRELDLSINQIQALPLSFARLHKLIKLNLDQNPLVFPPMEVVCKGIEAIRLFMSKRWHCAASKEEEGQLMAPDASWRLSTRLHLIQQLFLRCFQDCFRIHSSSWHGVS